MLTHPSYTSRPSAKAIPDSPLLLLIPHSIKSQYIPEEVRSGVMNIFRVPLNAIMVVLLSLIEVQQVSIQTTLVRPPHSQSTTRPALQLSVHGSSRLTQGTSKVSSHPSHL